MNFLIPRLYPYLCNPTRTRMTLPVPSVSFHSFLTLLLENMAAFNPNDVALGLLNETAVDPTPPFVCSKFDLVEGKRINCTQNCKLRRSITPGFVKCPFLNLKSKMSVLQKVKCMHVGTTPATITSGSLGLMEPFSSL